jgi:L-threonylcarbamoyladenylate synthase
VTPGDVETFARCVSVGGVAVFPADTVYGLATDPDSDEGIWRIYRLKGRPPGKPAAVMFFDLDLALAALPELEERTRSALTRLLPGGITVLLPNPQERFRRACAPDASTLGLRVPRLEGALAPLAGMRWPVLQTSANVSGGPDPRRVDEVPEQIRQNADAVLDAGELPGTPSTVVDLRRYEDASEWRVIREGAVPADRIAEVL